MKSELLPDNKQLLDNINDGVYSVDKERRIVYWNPAAERITGYSADEVIGSHCWDNILMHVDCEGKSLCLDSCPIAETISTKQNREAEVFLRHKDGYRIPVLVRTIPIKNDDGEILGAFEVFREDYNHEAAEKQLDELRKLALLDPLTSIANRRYLEEIIHARLDEYKRYGWNFGILFVDIDWFKQINDKHGHDAGDSILRTVTQTIIHNIRGFDVVGRWGGDEFVIVMPNTEIQELKTIANRIKVLVDKSTLDYNGKSISTTVSIGGTIVREDDTYKRVVDRADALMYRCKEAGRNCILVQ